MTIAAARTGSPDSRLDILYIMDAIYHDLLVTLKGLGDLENLHLKTVNQRQKIGAAE